MDQKLVRQVMYMKKDSIANCAFICIKHWVLYDMAHLIVV